MQKGKQLERFLDSICAQINRLGGHAHKNHPRRTIDGKFLEGEPFDYEFFIGKQVHCFDAKENYSSPDYWRIRLSGLAGTRGNPRLLKEAQNLVNCGMNGAQAYFLVYFGHEKSAVSGKLIRFEASIILSAIIRFEQRIHYSEGKIWDIEKILQEAENNHEE